MLQASSWLFPQSNVESSGKGRVPDSGQSSAVALPEGAYRSWFGHVPTLDGSIDQPAIEPTT
jgi:hypothetical protein